MLLVNEPEFDRPQALRNRLGKLKIVRSGYRSSEFNRELGGATRFNRLNGAAFDIAMANQERVASGSAAREVGFHRFGL